MLEMPSRSEMKYNACPSGDHCGPMFFAPANPPTSRTFPLCTSLNYRDWAGYYAVSAYETHHEHEYNAIRNGAAMSPQLPLQMRSTRDMSQLRSQYYQIAPLRSLYQTKPYQPFTHWE